MHLTKVASTSASDSKYGSKLRLRFQASQSSIFACIRSRLRMLSIGKRCSVDDWAVMTAVDMHLLTSVRKALQVQRRACQSFLSQRSSCKRSTRTSWGNDSSEEGKLGRRQLAAMFRLMQRNGGKRLMTEAHELSLSQSGLQSLMFTLHDQGTVWNQI